jgi:hypothetical protein
MAGNSTYTLRSVLDGLVGRGMKDPSKAPSGVGLTLTLELANDAMADLICDRFNWKWNSALAVPFLTNSWQQDYPQPAQPNGVIGWGEDCTQTDINNTMIPKPNWRVTWRRALPRISSFESYTPPPGWQLQWMYNQNLSFGVWPGANVTFYPLITGGAVMENPIMSMIDANGNLLIVTGFGTTGSTAPLAAVDAAEGVTVTDGSVTWTVVSPTSQGFRVYPLPNATGPVYQIAPTYQLDPPKIETIGQLLNPIPDSYVRHFRRIFRYHCLGASPDMNDKKEWEAGQPRNPEEFPPYLVPTLQAARQGDKEINSYGLIPATSPVENVWPNSAGYRTADNPY